MYKVDRVPSGNVDIGSSSISGDGVRAPRDGPVCLVISGDESLVFGFLVVFRAVFVFTTRFRPFFPAPRGSSSNDLLLDDSAVVEGCADLLTAEIVDNEVEGVAITTFEATCNFTEGEAPKVALEAVSSDPATTSMRGEPGILARALVLAVFTWWR